MPDILELRIRNHVNVDLLNGTSFKGSYTPSLAGYDLIVDAKKRQLATFLQHEPNPDQEIVEWVGDAQPLRYVDAFEILEQLDAKWDITHKGDEILIKKSFWESESELSKDFSVEIGEYSFALLSSILDHLSPKAKAQEAPPTSLSTSEDLDTTPRGE
jgi:hypothetical protein